MKNLISLIIIFFSFETFSQTNKNVLGSFALGDNVLNYKFHCLPNDFYSFNIDDKNRDTDITFNEENSTKATPDSTEKSNVPDESQINDIAKSIVNQLKTKLVIVDDDPIIANLKINNQVIYCYNVDDIWCPNKNYHKIQNKFNVEKISIEFEDGTIKNIIADLKFNDKSGISNFDLPIRFKNLIPFSVSNKNDVFKFPKYRLYVSNFSDLKDRFDIYFNNKFNEYRFQPKNDLVKVDSTQFKKINLSNFKFEHIFISLSDLIVYEYVLQSNTEDYSPANSVINLNKKDSIKELRKEKRSQILTVRTFSDLVGIQDDQPNGLMQIEASKKFNLWTARLGTRHIYFGLFTSIEPKLIFSKIEKNNNKLIFGAVDLFSTPHSLDHELHFLS